MTTGGELRRRLGVSDAVGIGAGSMIAAGVFAAWSPTAGCVVLVATLPATALVTGSSVLAVGVIVRALTR